MRCSWGQTEARCVGVACRTNGSWSPWSHLVIAINVEKDVGHDLCHGVMLCWIVGQVLPTLIRLSISVSIKDLPMVKRLFFCWLVLWFLLSDNCGQLYHCFVACFLFSGPAIRIILKQWCTVLLLRAVTFSRLFANCHKLWDRTYIKHRITMLNDEYLVRKIREDNTVRQYRITTTLQQLLEHTVQWRKEQTASVCRALLCSNTNRNHV